MRRRYRCKCGHEFPRVLYDEWTATWPDGIGWFDVGAA